ncbi:MAG TPA: ATP-binding protein [Prolixibacteraceae bacterium]|jgi:two-component system NtrC family sensor kinase|nr:ATP-binding protein [Prolixibacteraceae bacterium]
MNWFKKVSRENIAGSPIISHYVKFSSSIYGRVVFIIALLSVFLFVSFNIIFRSVNEQYLNTVIRQSGNNIGSIVEGAMYHSMLQNDKGALQNTLDIINTLPGIDEVNMYDSDDNLVYSSFPSDPGKKHTDPNCLNCHTNMRSMFPATEKSYRIIDENTDCLMNKSDNGSRHLLIRSPIMNERSCYTSSCHAHQETDTVLGSLIIKIPLKAQDEAIQKSSAEFFLLAIFSTLLLASLLLIFTRKKIKDPLNELVKVSVAVANGDRNTRLEIKPNQLDDMRMVSNAFNDMLDNLHNAAEELENWSQQLEYKVQKKTEELGAAQNELMHVERLASLGKLSSSVAHEINNPLSGILIYTKLLLKQANNPELFTSKRESMIKNLKLIESETKRCGDIVKGLLDFSRKDQNDFEPRHLHEILAETYELMTHPIKIANIEFTSEFAATADLIYCNPNQIKQACIAMLVNASEAISENGRITIRTKNPDAESVIFEIADNGVGISEEDISHIFEPFFSTKQDVRGIGLGLAIVHGIIQNHKGRIHVDSEPNCGTTFSINLPLIKS